MATSFDSEEDRCHRLIAETRPRMAKAKLRKPEQDASRQAAGKVIARVMTLSGMNLQEFAATVNRDERQVYRWFTGAERAQLDALLAAETLGPHIVVAFAEATGSRVEIETTVRIKQRTA